MTSRAQEPESSVENINTRVRWLIDTAHGGSVNAAARDTGVPQPTLARIADGRVKNPNAGAVARIARFYGTTSEWLLEGRGQGPDRPEGRAWGAEVLRWMSLISTLDLPPDAFEALHDVPEATGDATTELMERLLATGKPDQYPRATRPLRDASTLEYRAWTLWLEEWISLAGRVAVRDAVADNVELFKKRFSPH